MKWHRKIPNIEYTTRSQPALNISNKANFSSQKTWGQHFRDQNNTVIVSAEIIELYTKEN